MLPSSAVQSLRILLIYRAEKPSVFLGPIPSQTNFLGGWNGLQPRAGRDPKFYIF